MTVPQESLPVIRLHPDDNVVVARVELSPGAELASESLTVRDPIPAGHKLATADLKAGERILKYGQTMGLASTHIPKGSHVHTHNVEIGQHRRDYEFGTEARPAQAAAEADQAFFSGIVRADGRVATRNFIGVLPTVSCSAGVVRLIADAVSKEELASFPRVDGVAALSHASGCGMGRDEEGYVRLQRALAGYARHPNFAGVLLVGLGCEANQLDDLLGNMNLEEGPLLRTLNIQDQGGTRGTVGKGAAIVREMMARADRVERTRVAADKLILGLECGGSDAFSGISANPALGRAVDLLAAQGGTAILSETPEIYGAEHLLIRRAKDEPTGRKLAGLIRWWEEYTEREGGKINNNPSPGNKAGGLTTILEKSLGAASKGGTTALNGVFGFAEPVQGPGLVFMDTPGYDVVSITGLVAGGANIVCFTTGRGTVVGNRPAPTLKLATNSPMYERLAGDMDLDCGGIVDGKESLGECGQRIFELILQTASGRRTKSEEWGFGDLEFAPWPLGAMI